MDDAGLRAAQASGSMRGTLRERRRCVLGGVKPESIIMKFVSLVLATAVAAVIGASPSLAQSAGASSGDTSPSNPQMNAPTYPDQNQWGRDRDWYGRPGGYGHGWMGPQAGWMMGGGPGWMMGQQRPGWMGRHGWQRWHRGARGARFTFTRGDGRVDIQCPANQSLKDCVEAASTLIDKVAGMGQQPERARPPGGDSGAGPTPGSTPGGPSPDKPGQRM